MKQRSCLAAAATGGSHLSRLFDEHHAAAGVTHSVHSYSNTHVHNTFTYIPSKMPRGEAAMDEKSWEREEDDENEEEQAVEIIVSD